MRKRLVVLVLTVALAVCSVMPAMAEEVVDPEVVATETVETESVTADAEAITDVDVVPAEEDTLTAPSPMTKIEVADVTLNTLNEETFFAITHDYEDQSLDNKTLFTFASSDETVVTVNENGALTALKAGEAEITVTANAGYYDEASEAPTTTFKVTVGNLISGVVEDPSGETTDKMYYKDGVFQSDANGLLKVDGIWYNFVDGVVYGPDVVKNSAGWWLVEDNGTVSFANNGFAENANGWWSGVNSQVTFKENSVKKGIVNGEEAWWHVVNSKVEFDTTVAKNANGWWYIKDGKVDFTATSVVKRADNNTWWYVENGKVNFNYTGLADNENGTWYVNKGKVDFTANTVIKGTYQGETAWWYVKNGKVTITDTVAKNSAGWWCVKNGKVDFTANTVAKNEYGWWAIQNGKVNFSFTGLAKNDNGYWYCKNGKVDFSFKGIASNSAGKWYCEGGKVNFNFNGTYSTSTMKYTITNGKVTKEEDIDPVRLRMIEKANGLSSSTKWLLLMDYTNCRVGVFYGSKGNWTLKYYWLCSPGAPSTPTVIGTFSVTGKGTHFGENNGYTCWYYTQFYGNYLFHSVLYNVGSKTSMIDGRLGQHLSHGCIRLDINNAKWIYDNIPYGTKVVTYK